MASVARQPTLLFLYGPPAVGKLTVAQAVGERHPFKILHNHLTLDPVAAILDFGTPAFWEVVSRFRVDLVQTAARECVDLIYTYVYAPGDEPHVEAVVQQFVKGGGRVIFVQLVAPPEDLLRRVSDPSRAAYGKPRDAGTLRGLLRQQDLYQPIKDRPSLVLNTAELSPTETAERIVEHLAAAA